MSRDTSKQIRNNGYSANWGSKRDTNGNQIAWFGYKLHIATDVIAELPLAFKVTPASTNDGIMPKISRLLYLHALGT